jgi:hypothetical protein
MHKPMTTFIYFVITISYAEGWGFSNTQLITTGKPAGCTLAIGFLKIKMIIFLFPQS